MKKIFSGIISTVFILILSATLPASAILVEHDEVGRFSDGMAWIRSGDKYGYIDESGELVIPIKFHIGNQWTGYSYFNEDGYAVV